MDFWEGIRTRGYISGPFRYPPTFSVDILLWLAPLSFVPGIRSGDKASELGTCSVVGKYARKAM